MPASSATDPATRYALDVLEGKKYTTGRLVQLACERHLLDLEHGPERGLVWEPGRGREVEEFIGLLRHFKGRWAGQFFTLEPWEQFIIYSVFGWLRENDADLLVRRYSTAYDECSRKQGKSSLSSAIGLYLFAMDEEPGAEIYTLATKKEQACIIHSMAQEFVRHSELRSYVKSLTYNMSIAKTASKYEPLGADSRTLDGLNPHGGLIDEYHAHPTAQLYNVIKTGMGARDQPLLFIITTAGERLDSPCGREREFAENVLKSAVDGSTENDSYFAYIASPDEDDDPEDEETWKKGNPNLGVTVRLEDLRTAYQQAREKPLEYNDFLRKRLNIWTETKASWISFDATSRWWTACGGKVDLELLASRPCYGGLDLATVKDLTAYALVWPPTDGDDDWYLYLRCWCPEEGLAQRVRNDRVPYDIWHKRGWLEITEGNRIDYQVVKADILDLASRLQVVDIGYDPWNAEQITQELVDEGLSLYEIRQSFRDLSKPMKDLESLVLERNLRHGDNEAFRWMLGNMAVREDENGNIAPSKKKARERIDGVVATIMAIARAREQQAAPDPVVMVV